MLSADPLPRSRQRAWCADHAAGFRINPLPAHHPLGHPRLLCALALGEPGRELYRRCLRRNLPIDRRAAHDHERDARHLVGERHGDELEGLLLDELLRPHPQRVTASAMAASVQDASSFAGPREFAAFLGMTPKQNSSGGKPRLGRISKMGNRELRKLLVVGAHAVLFHRRPHTDPLRTWAKKLIEKKPFKLVAVALANKMARIAFAILRGKTVYQEIPA